MINRKNAENILAAHGQGHVLRWFDRLDESAQKALLEQIASVDFSWLERIWRESEAAPATAGMGQVKDIQPYEEVIRLDDHARSLAKSEGEAALAAGKVAVLLAAGGEGSRLGFNGPKGAYPLGQVSGRTLYQIHAEQILGLRRRYGHAPTLYVLTSASTYAPTKSFFIEHHWFGLAPEKVHIFQQGMVPAVDENGHLLMDRGDHLVMSPNGNGGLFAGLEAAGAFPRMAALGEEIISYIQVDNPLSVAADPYFIGYHLRRKSEYSCKAIRKTGPEEKVGCYARVNDRLAVVEYTELPQDMAKARKEDGELRFGYANPGFFIWSRDFAKRQAMRKDLPFHRAHKKIAALNEAGELVTPTVPNGFKFECFAMDTLADASSTLVLECPRDDEFAPVKNALGEDSPQSARGLMTKLYQRWLLAAGAVVENQQAAIEISPTYAVDADDLAKRLSPGFIVRQDLFLK